MFRTPRLLASLLIAGGLGACGGGGSSSPTPVTTVPPAKAVIKVLIDPNPIHAVSTGNDDFPWDFRVNLQVSDSGGVGFIVTSMETTITSAQSGGVLTRSDQNPFVGVKVAAFGQETRQLHSGAYRMENHAKEGKVTFKMNFSDDRGNTSAFDGSVNVLTTGEVVYLPN
jgi:hypothetical protein